MIIKYSVLLKNERKRERRKYSDVIFIIITSLLNIFIIDQLIIKLMDMQL